MATIPVIRQLFAKVRCDPVSPWFLKNTPWSKRYLFVLLYGSLRRLSAMPRIAFIVLRSWWNHPLEPEIVSNSSKLVSNSFEGVFKPILWMASVGIAGIVGSDVATSHSSTTSSKQLVIWIYIAFGFALCLALYHWWKFLDRLRRVLSNWVIESSAKNILDRRTEDIALFGYTFGDNFRHQFNLKGVKFLAILTFSAVVYISYRNGHQ